MSQKINKGVPAERQLTSGGSRERAADGKQAPRPAALPVAWNQNLQRHWLPVDDGGAELITATFGSCPQPPSRRVALDPPSRRDIARETPAPPASGHASQNRRRATLVVFLIGLALLLAAGSTPPVP